MDEIPQWAKERALTVLHGGDYVRLLHRDGTWVENVARYIASHEEGPVDPLLIEARNIAAATLESLNLPDGANLCLLGRLDDEGLVTTALAALRRGIELARVSS